MYIDRPVFFFENKIVPVQVSCFVYRKEMFTLVCHVCFTEKNVHSDGVCVCVFVFVCVFFSKKYRAANIHICLSLKHITGTDTCVSLFISKIETQRG